MYPFTNSKATFPIAPSSSHSSNSSNSQSSIFSVLPSTKNIFSFGQPPKNTDSKELNPIKVLSKDNDENNKNTRFKF